MNDRKSVLAPEKRLTDRNISQSSNEMAGFLTQQPNIKVTNK